MSSDWRGFFQPGFRWERPWVFPTLLALQALACFAWFHYITWTQWASNHVYLVDAGLFDTALSGIRHGHFLQVPLHWDIDATYFAIHFRPILLLLAPFYLLADHVMTFLVLVNLGMVLAVVPLSLFARSVLRHDGLALLVGLLYLFNHFTASIHLAIHPEILAMGGMFLAFHATRTGSMAAWLTGILVALAVKQDFAIYVAAFSLFLWYFEDRERCRRMAVSGLVIAVAWWVLALVMMRLSGQEALAVSGNRPMERFAHMGDSLPAILIYIITNPLDIVGRIMREPLLSLFASVGFLSLIDWRGLGLVVLGAAVFMLSSQGLVSELHYYYSYPALPFLFYTAIRGMGVLLEAGSHPSAPRRHAFLMGFLVVVIAFNALLPTRTDGLHRMPFEVTPRHQLAGEIARLIPPDAAVAVQYDLYCRVPNRPVKLPFRLQWLDHVDWVFIDLRGRPADLLGEDKAQEREEIFALIAAPPWQVFFEADGYLLLKRI